MSFLKAAMENMVMMTACTTAHNCHCQYLNDENWRWMGGGSELHIITLHTNKARKSGPYGLMADSVAIQRRIVHDLPPRDGLLTWVRGG
jgi:hypothetical protein